MAHVFHKDTLEFNLRQSPIPEFSWHTSERLSDLLGTKRLKFDVRSLDPDKFSYPYHFHRNAEEMFVILSGKAALRMPDEVIELVQGDIVFFEMGPSGAHQLYNHTELPCVFLDIRTITDLDVCEYPDSGKINILPQQEAFLAKDKVDYYFKEDKVRENWPEHIVRRNQ
jgi:uncharacterized cupin superfamily protein